jgi:hypothetical protein
VFTQPLRRKPQSYTMKSSSSSNTTMFFIIFTAVMS